jgi:hypothetical protein
MKAPRPYATYLTGIIVDGHYSRGIAWGPAQVYAAFEFLANVVEDVVPFPASDFPEPPKPPADAKLAPVSLDNAEAICASNGLPCKWFKFDANDVQSEAAKRSPPGTSWFFRLRDVCDRTMELLITLHFGIPEDPEKPYIRQKWTGDFVTKHLQRTVTGPPPPAASTLRKAKLPAQFASWIPFPMGQGAPLCDWRSSYIDAGILRNPMPTAASAGIASLRRGGMMPIPTEKLIKARQTGDDKTIEILTTLKTNIESAGVSIPPEMTPALLGSIAPYPMYPTLPPPSDPFALVFMSSNVHGQVALMGERLKAEWLRLYYLRKQVDQELETLSGEIATLTQAYEDLKAQNKEFDQAAGRWERRRGERRAIEVRVTHERLIRDEKAEFADLAAGGPMTQSTDWRPEGITALDPAAADKAYDHFPFHIHML